MIKKEKLLLADFLCLIFNEVEIWKNHIRKHQVA